MPRPISNSFRRFLQAEAGEDVILAFVTFQHEDLDAPLRVVNDTVDYIIDGDRFYGAPFDVLVVEDGPEKTPRAVLTVQNVDREIGDALEAVAPHSPRVAIRVLTSDLFDLTVKPRVPLDTIDWSDGYEATNLEFTEVTIDALQVTGTLILRTYGQMPFPFLRATRRRCPGLFYGR